MQIDVLIHKAESRQCKKKELEQARAQGLLQGSAGRISDIRSMYGHQLTVENIADLINQSREYVSAIIDLMTKYLAEDDVMIARRLME